MTFTVRVTQGGLSEAEARMARRSRTFRPRLDAALRAAAATAVAEARRLAPVNVGALRSMIQAFRVGPLAHEVSANAPYSPFVERGRQPGESQPPVEALIPWVDRKGIADAVAAAYGIRNRERAARSAAFLVARAIKRKGIRPVLFMARGTIKGVAVLRARLAVLRSALRAGR